MCFLDTGLRRCDELFSADRQAVTQPTKSQRASPTGRASARKRKTPAVGFVSLGCPKALVDSERILTELRAEGYLIAPRYEDSDLVIVNTCGFIDEAVTESLDAIGEALDENGKVIVTGCLGAKGDIVKKTHPRVLAVTGPHATAEVMQEVRRPTEGQCLSWSLLPFLLLLAHSFDNTG